MRTFEPFLEPTIQGLTRRDFVSKGMGAGRERTRPPVKSATEHPRISTSDLGCAAYTFVEMQNQDSVEAAVPSTAPGAPNNGPSLLIRGLRKSFADVVAVDGLDLEVTRGECFGLLGPNGAGKTTTIEICEGLTTPDQGTVELLGRN